ncbi:phenoloxidase-activating factor 3-like [Drosophila ficusphila]|uniref:phenoloxidase-activating factor 3-like n=1 Tax=Drosophila ficusphila TaxID=30025 RepID=UPI0007E64F1F|nr:phenoloxidase-activating factor 3-like [Drosophila ficusphila]
MGLRSAALTIYLCGVLLSISWAKPRLHFGSCLGSKKGQCRPVEECQEEAGYIQAKDSSECFETVCCLKKLTSYPQSEEYYCNHDLRPHISNGETTEIGEFPWMAMLLYGDRLEPKCGGSLVGKKWVLTAAHCVPIKDHEEELRRVRLGVWDYRQTKDCRGPKCTPPPQDFAIEQAIVHELYKPTETEGTSLQRHSNDIALLLLGRTVTYSEFVQPICLPPLYSPSRLGVYADYSLTIAGWGGTSELSLATSPVKIKAQVNGWSRDQCRLLYEDVGLGQMCAGGGSARKGSCFGDSGGPVMDGNQLVGIVSLGESKCGSDRGPMVITRVDSYVAWLERHLLGLNSIKPKSIAVKPSHLFQIFVKNVFS